MINLIVHVHCTIQFVIRVMAPTNLSIGVNDFPPQVCLSAVVSS